MYAQIHTVSETSESSGKTMRVEAAPGDVEFDLLEIGGVQRLRIRAKCRDRIASGWQGGVPRPVTREFFLDLEKEELEELLSRAHKKNILTRMSISRKPDPEQTNQLQQTLRDLNAELREARERIGSVEAKIALATEALR